jgi:hypothetical protein
MKTQTKVAKAPGPALVYNRKQTIDPATAPDVLTPRTKRARVANPIVTMIAIQRRPPADVIPAVQVFMMAPESGMANCIVS